MVWPWNVRVGRRQASPWFPENTKCSLCQESVENPTHAMFICDHPQLTQVRLSQGKPFQTPLISSSADLPTFVDALSIQLPLHRNINLYISKMEEDARSLRCLSTQLRLPLTINPYILALNGRGCRVASMFVHSTSTPSQHQPLHFGVKWKRMPERERPGSDLFLIKLYKMYRRFAPVNHTAEGKQK